MLKLVNISTFDDDIKRFKDDADMKNFLEEYKLDGFELIQFIKWNENIIKKENVKGLHLRYYPTWLDFWHGDMEELLIQFENKENIREYYGGLNREVIVNAYREEIQTLIEIGAKYAVFHVGHARTEDFFDHNFIRTDEEIIRATIELVNEVMKGFDEDFYLLFENLWCPGLSFKEPKLAAMLLEGVEYKNKGFMLDTGHLMNTNFYINNEREGIEYVLHIIDNLGELKDYIKGIHMNCSVSGEYILKSIKKYRNLNRKMTLKEINESVFPHILKIDLHKPFQDAYAKEIVNSIKPEFLVYEFLTKDRKNMEEYIKKQNMTLNL